MQEYVVTPHAVVAVHVCPHGQALPHDPQLVFVVRSVQTPEQHPCSAAPVLQTLPQAPQLFTSVLVLAQ
jgi:hypothetical protein